MQNIQYLERVVNEENRFGVVLKDIALKHTDHIQLQMALSLLEFFNGGKFVDENDIEKIDNLFYVSKEKYFKPKSIPKSRVFSIRVNLDDSEEEVNNKITELKHKVIRYHIPK